MKRACILGTIIIAATTAAAQAQTHPALPFTLSKETTVITAPLNPDGTPNYIQALNDKYGKGVTPQNNGFVAFLEIVGTGDDVIAPEAKAKALQLTGARASLSDAKPFQTYTSFVGVKNPTDPVERESETQDLTTARKRLWKESEFSRVAAYLKAQQKQLDTFVEISSKPQWWIPAVSRDNRMATLMLPSLGQLRAAADALAGRATLKAAQGDFNGFSRDCMAVKRLARQLGSGASVIERLVGNSMDMSANDTWGAVIGAGVLTDAQCKSLDLLHAALLPVSTVGECADVAERWTNLDLFEAVAMGKLEVLVALTAQNSPETNPGGMLKFLQTIDRKSVDWNIALKEFNSTMDHLVAALKKPELRNMLQAVQEINNLKEQWGADAAASAGGLAKHATESQKAYSERVSRAIMAIYLPDLKRVEEIHRRGQLETQMTQLLLAAAQVHVKTGKWPEKLADLAPAYVKTIPQDLYPVDAPGELQYTVAPNGIRIWSVGDNNRPFGVGVQLLN